MNFPHASPSFKKLNPEYFGAGVARLRPTQPQRPGKRQAPGPHPAQADGPRRVVVGVVVFRRQLLDPDNLIGGCKSFQDAIAATLGIDDGDPRIRFEYSKHLTTGKPGTLVRIETFA